MRVWLYYRLSNDDDKEQNSLLNQRKITLEYTLCKGYTVAGESSDDNASGMNFQREGIRQIVKAVEAGSIDAIIVKDLSRLGRHKIHTALLIDFLRENGVRVLSVTEGVDTFDENDDLTIGVRGLMNDYYARDIGRKIRTGYRQKQKSGIVIIAPFGYWKNKNTRQVARASSLRAEIQSLDTDIEALLMERIKDKANSDRYTAVITKLTADHEKTRLELNNLEAHDTKLRRRLRELAKHISSLDEVLKNTHIEKADLRHLTEYIELKQDGKTVEVRVISKEEN